MRSRALPRLCLAAIGLAFALTARLDAQEPFRTSTSPGQHADHEDDAPAEKAPAAANDDSAQELPAFIPRLTDEDRQAAFPDVEGHAVHDQAVHYFVLVDRLEWEAAADGGGLNLHVRGWIGRNRDRLWFRADGHSDEGRIGEAQAHVLYGHQFSRWWDIVGGIRQDFRPGSAQTWAAVGVQGLAPYWFEIEATAYLGASGRTQARFEVEYELLLTNRLILQPLVEVQIAGKPDLERGVGAGVSSTDAGFRLRYEFRREIAPYVGVVWSHAWGETAGLADAAGEERGGARAVTGLRLWF